MTPIGPSTNRDERGQTPCLKSFCLKRGRVPHESSLEAEGKLSGNPGLNVACKAQSLTYAGMVDKSENPMKHEH